MNFSKKNITRHWPSTIMGMVVLLALLVPVYLGSSSITDIMPALVLVIPFLLYGQDKQNPPSAGMAVALCLLLLSSCITRQKCLDRFGAISETVSKVDTVQVITPPDTVFGSITNEQILKAIQLARLDTLLKQRQGRAKVQVVYVPKIKEIQVQAECEPDTVDHYITQTITKELIPEPWDYAQLYARKLRSGLLWFLIPMVALFLLFLILKFLRP